MVWVSDDAISWELLPHQLAFEGAAMQHAATDGTRVVVTGIRLDPSSRSPVVWVSEDGLTWTFTLEEGPIVISREAALHYYDVFGRTWERQAFVKARPVAGDTDLGRELLERDDLPAATELLNQAVKLYWAAGEQAKITRLRLQKLGAA